MPVVLKPNKKASEIDKNTVAEIAASLKIARPIAEVLYTRGFDSVEKAAGFINAGADEMCRRNPHAFRPRRISAMEPILPTSSKSNFIYYLRPEPLPFRVFLRILNCSIFLRFLQHDRSFYAKNIFRIAAGC